MSIFPFYGEEVRAFDSLEVFSEYDYDFEKNEFKLKGGQPYIVYYDEAIKVWISKALLTDRYKFLAYDSDFGSELNTLVGHVKDIEILKLEMKRFIIESIMVNPYIVELSDFSLKKDDDIYCMSFYVKTIYEGFTIEKRWQNE